MFRSLNQFLAAVVIIELLIYFAWELAKGGGDPNHKDHNPPRTGV